MTIKKIGEYMKMIGVSAEFLKFYDKKNLVKPLWRDDASCRYYADYQAIHFAEYHQLSQLGFSLEEAKTILETYSLNERIECYEKCYEKKLEEYQNLSTLINQLYDMNHSLKHIKEKQNWRIETIPTSFFLVKDMEKDLPRQTPLWKDHTILHFALEVTLKNQSELKLTERNCTKQWGWILSKTEIGNISVEKEFYIKHEISNDLCFVYDHNILAEYDDSKKLNDKVWDFSEPLEILEKYKLNAKGRLYQKRLCVTHEEKNSYVQVQTIIPLVFSERKTERSISI